MLKSLEMEVVINTSQVYFEEKVIFKKYRKPWIIFLKFYLYKTEMKSLGFFKQIWILK